MNKFTLQIITAVSALAFSLQGNAQVPVEPPFQETQEVWEFTYKIYKDVLSYTPPISKNVFIVRDNQEVYIKGIFDNYPDSWIKGTLDGNKLLIDSKQIISVEDDDVVYFYGGGITTGYSEGNTYRYDSITLVPSDSPVKFIIYDNGDTMNVVDIDEAASFWYNTSDYGEEEYWLWVRHDDITGTITESTGTGFPDLDYPIHMIFRKKGVGGIGAPVIDNAVAPMYDLQGRRVNPETASPGIYIRAGKKIIVR